MELLSQLENILHVLTEFIILILEFLLIGTENIIIWIMYVSSKHLYSNFLPITIQKMTIMKYQQ